MMADIDDEIQGLDVALPDEGPIEIKLDEPIHKKADDQPDEREVALSELKKQLEDQKAFAEKERQARLQAEESARRHSEEAEFAKVETQDSNFRVVTSAIEQVEAFAQNAERAYADAMQAGDYTAAAKAQRAMSQCEAQLSQLSYAKKQLETSLEKRTAEGRVEAPRSENRPSEPPQDPVEALANRLTPKSAEWLRAHPQAAGQVNKLTAAHTAATELEGIPVESPEYFAYIEQRLGITQAEKKPAAAPAKKPMASAPVQSGSAYSSGGRSGGQESIHLTSAEVEMALLQEPEMPRQKALEAYARNKAECIRRGELH
jgi:hypothetical protein